MPQQINCPRCGVLLQLQDVAPPRLTCPRCLGIVANPRATTMNVAPRRVLPLDADTATDAGHTKIGLLVLAIGMLVGGIMSVVMLHSVGVAVVLMVGAVAIVPIVLARRLSAPSMQPIATARSGPPPLPTDGTLQYQSQQLYRRERGILPLPFMGGFFGSLLMCGGAFVLMASTVRYDQLERQVIAVAMLAALAGTAVASGFLGKRPAFRGIGRGFIIGLCLGMFALGPCAFCYMLA